jgi:hypothetical protein
MPTNRSRRKRIREIIALDESIEQLFLTGICERNTPGWRLRVSRFFDQGAELKEAWEAHKGYLLRKWKAEGITESWITRGDSTIK